MTLQGRTKLKMWLVLVAVFVLGSVTGVALTGLYRSRAAGDRPETREKAMHETFDMSHDDGFRGWDTGPEHEDRGHGKDETMS